MTNGTVLALGALQTNEQKLLVETGKPTSGHLSPADREPVSEDAEATGVRAPRTTGGTHDDKSTLV